MTDDFDYFRADGEGVYEYELRAEFEDYLNDAYETVTVCGYEYEQGTALKELDPTAFRMGFLDWIDSEVKEGNLSETDPEGQA